MIVLSVFEGVLAGLFDRRYGSIPTISTIPVEFCLANFYLTHFFPFDLSCDLSDAVSHDKSMLCSYKMRVCRRSIVKVIDNVFIVRRCLCMLAVPCNRWRVLEPGTLWATRKISALTVVRRVVSGFADVSDLC